MKDAIGGSRDLAVHHIETFPQGSYANRLNVPGTVTSTSVSSAQIRSFLIFRMASRRASLALPFPATYQYAQYKDEVEAALVAKFGRQNVVRGNKAFDIHENTYRVDADAVACFEYRWYFFDVLGQLHHHKGTALLTDREGRRVTNFPKQQYDNGVAKNNATGRRYKALVRILKCLKNEMDDIGIEAASPMPSFLVESLVYNVLNDRFQHPTYVEDVLAVLAFLYAGTEDDASCSAWTESNGFEVPVRAASGMDPRTGS